jgi:eukaryotic-like serine/threonine-protein kinase
MSLAPGTIFGQYEIRSPLGAGGMGEVYRAHDTRLDREVAIKVLPESLTADPDRVRRFEQEARAAAALNHPNILAVYQMATHDGVSYMGGAIGSARFVCWPDTRPRRHRAPCVISQSPH